ncbi:hypothetical protein HMPREF9630_02104 [Peptoanaerobacter stomatis]|uniref:Methionine biosynthesis protein MetW-like protein n=1 Tax=Peptoanaerobacter stomatis TaxID=796937 RepID=U6Q2R3_9FIRM|nr:class I SAM-dependent methyltransferase [Peptoanaerobacter stomatis]EJZ44327.1 hypothetical protein HMPREF9630_02104 [Peptoanaerobacter stomatis]
MIKKLLKENILKYKDFEEKENYTQKRYDYDLNRNELLKSCNYLFNEISKKIVDLNNANSIDINLNINKGNFVKKFLKKIIRKLIWWMLQPIVIQQKWYNELNLHTLGMLLDNQKNIYNLIETLSNQNKNVNDLYIDYRNEVKLYQNSVRDRIENLEESLILMKEKIKNTPQNNVLHNISLIEKKIDDYIESNSLDDIVDYTNFQNKFRGSYEEIKQRLNRYKEYFSKGDLVLDIGCGRGEMLDVLSDIGVKTIGIDKNEITIKQCRDNGFRVYNEDMFIYLKKFDNYLLDGITCIQVIEHISTKKLVDLIRLCKDKLNKDGILILETPNPRVLSTFSINFYVDPTHIRPVHPEFLKYILEENGFEIVKEDYPEYSWVKDGTIPKIEEGIIRNNEEMNQRIDYLNNMLYGSTDYAIISKKI